jgi:alkyl hydroperoxide reductase subunit AhpC
VPAVFIIDRDAKIRIRYYNPDYKERLSGEALLKAARDSVE